MYAQVSPEVFLIIRFANINLSSQAAQILPILRRGDNRMYVSSSLMVLWTIFSWNYCQDLDVPVMPSSASPAERVGVKSVTPST